MPWQTVRRNRPASDKRPLDAVPQPLSPSFYPLVTRLQSVGARLAGSPYSPLPSYHHPCLIASKTCFRPGSSRQSVGRHHVPRHLPLGGLRVHIRPFPVSHRSVPFLQEASNPHRDTQASSRLQLLQSPIPGVIALPAHCAASPLPLVSVTHLYYQAQAPQYIHPSPLLPIFASFLDKSLPPFDISRPNTPPIPTKTNQERRAHPVR